MIRYVFTSQRLGFRVWEDSDIAFLNQLNSNEEVMRFFPKIPSDTENRSFIKRMQNQYAEKKYCYFLVDELGSGNTIGFIGLSYQNYDSDFTPAVDIGWRIMSEFWGRGYATEGATKCLEYAKHELGLSRVISVSPKVNSPSISVMEKIGLQKVKEFNHPLLEGNPYLESCVLYEISKL
jgi:RimJ/RimL family protein N-acetyltransferase